jgi:hypothetical protein
MKVLAAASLIQIKCVGPAGEMSDVIAQAVAAGIARARRRSGPRAAATEVNNQAERDAHKPHNERPHPVPHWEARHAVERSSSSKLVAPFASLVIPACLIFMARRYGERFFNGKRKRSCEQRGKERGSAH